MKVLELFAGSRSVGKAADQLHMKVFSTDLEPFEGIDHVVDVLEFDYTKLNPNLIWHIENPRGKLHKIPFMENLPTRHTVTYCQYGNFRMKPTDIWTNNTKWQPRPMCRPRGACHVSSPRGSHNGTQGMANSFERSKDSIRTMFGRIKECEPSLARTVTNCLRLARPCYFLITLDDFFRLSFVGMSQVS